MRGGQSVDAVNVQIESLAYDLDYKAKFTRAQFETEARDLKNNFALPIQEALARSGLKLVCPFTICEHLRSRLTLDIRTTLRLSS